MNPRAPGIRRAFIGIWKAGDTQHRRVLLELRSGHIIPLTSARAREAADQLHDAADQLDSTKGTP